VCLQIVGTSADVADQSQDMFESDARDGSVLTPTVLLGTFGQITRAMASKPQTRGIFRTDHECAAPR